MAGTEINLMAGPVSIWSAPYGEALPEKDNLAPGTITVTPGGNWVRDGFTIEEFHHIYTPTWSGVQPNEAAAQVKMWLESEESTVEYMQAEDDLTAMDRTVQNGTLTTVAAGADQTGQDILNVGNGVAVATPVALLILGTNPEGGSRILHCYKAVVTGPSDWARARTHVGRSVSYTLLEDTTQSTSSKLYQYLDITTSATS